MGAVGVEGLPSGWFGPERTAGEHSTSCKKGMNSVALLKI